MTGHEEWTVVRERTEGPLEIRAWEPGDGLACRYAERPSALACGRPVAMVRTWATRNPGATRATARVSVVCAIHVGTLLDYRQAHLGTQVAKAATEEVVAAHWDEYVAARDRHEARLRAAHWEHVPASIRAAVEGRS
jgi:hypothetical protein